MDFSIYTTDTMTVLNGGDIARGEWSEFDEASSYERRKPASYAVREAIDAAIKIAYALACEQGVQVIPYSGANPKIRDDGRIAAAVANIREAMEARRQKLAGQAPAPQYACAGARDGCRARVVYQGDYCARCQHDED